MNKKVKVNGLGAVFGWLFTFLSQPAEILPASNVSVHKRR